MRTINLKRWITRLFIVESFIFSQFLVFTFPGTVYAACNTVDWHVQAHESGYVSYGVAGRNTAPDLAIVYPYWVNSIGVIANDTNWVEGGWARSNVGNPFFFMAWMNQGVYNQKNLEEFWPPSDHNYTLSHSLGSTSWRLIIDGVKKWEKSLTFLNGTAIAQQERDNDCNHGTTHWWNLRKRNRDNAELSWGNQQQRLDNDPQYYWSKVSNTEFWVLRN